MFKLTKNIASTVLSLAIVGMVYLFVADTYKWWPFESVTETVKIDETPNVVTEIRGIKKFTTACYYGDVTISKVNTFCTNYIKLFFYKYTYENIW